MADYRIPESEHYQEAIDAVRKRVPVPRSVWDDMEAEEREHAFTVAQVSRIQVLQGVLDSIDKAVTEGTAIGDFRDEVADKLIEQWGGEIPGRLETIFRTSTQVAYAEGRHAINTAPAVREARPYWRFDDTDDDRECEVCGPCHGTILPADDPWWSEHHPPMHHQCRCTVTALSPEEAEEEGVAERGPDVDVDEGFGDEPSSEGKDWAPDLSGFDPELRAALEKELAAAEGSVRGAGEAVEAEDHATASRSVDAAAMSGGDFSKIKQGVDSAIEESGAHERVKPGILAVKDLESGDAGQMKLGTGNVTISEGTAENIKEFGAEMAKDPANFSKRIQRVFDKIDEVGAEKAMRDLIGTAQGDRDWELRRLFNGGPMVIAHESYHRTGPKLAPGAFAEHGELVEEVTTEVCARKYMRDRLGIRAPMFDSMAVTGYQDWVRDVTKSISDVLGIDLRSAYAKLEEASEAFKRATGTMEDWSQVAKRFTAHFGEHSDAVRRKIYDIDLEA